MSGFIYHTNCWLDHIMIMDLCNMIITLLILFHVTNHYFIAHTLLYIFPK